MQTPDPSLPELESDGLPVSDAAATGAGFMIDQLIEPRPAENMRGRYPHDYEKLRREPGFLVLRLRKLG